MATWEKIWNQYDEIGLIAGVSRVPGETNVAYRERLLSHEPYNSTKQGLSNFILNSLLQPAVNITERLIFTSLRVPLSWSKYQTIQDPSDDYYAPRIIIGTNTWIIESSDDDQKDISNVADSITWTLWKQPDGTYDQIWSSSQAPVANIELRYQWQDPDSTKLYIIRETATMLTWEEGEIVEADPDE
jgi:hypothetical protein